MGFVRELLDLFFPPMCLSCKAPLPRDRGVGLCEQCIALVENTQHTCEICGRPWVEGKICEECRKRRPSFERAVAPFVYGGPIKDLILNLKYAKGTYTVRFLAEAIAWEVHKRGIEGVDLVTAVPQQLSRFISRGYNQAALLGREVARILGLPFEGGILGVKGRGTQKGKGVEERWEERAEAFFIRKGWAFEGEAVLLVDDVVTTGATADACAKVLKGAGVSRVYVASAARAG